MPIVQRIKDQVLRRARPGGGTPSAISDERLAATLGVYAGMVDRVLDQPERWLSVDPRPVADRLPRRLLARARRTVSGDVHPGSPEWDAQPLDERVQWWTTRISVTAGTAAAAPRFAGLLADRLPVQAALGASASGLAVCAAAREEGVDDPEDWVPLLATVIFERDLAKGAATVPEKEQSERALTDAAADEGEPPGTMARLGEGSQRAVRGMWHLARVLLELQGIFDDRPHGGLLPRLIARLPVVGVAGGWFDERGAILAAAKETHQLLAAEDSPSG